MKHYKMCAVNLSNQCAIWCVALLELFINHNTLFITRFAVLSDQYLTTRCQKGLSNDNITIMTRLTEGFISLNL